ncbi:MULTISPECIES: phosphoenolpyruvate carboxylase [Halobacterium]|uniref:phosphoenolpyruvate carboxylase n=1 Tax=Halobacterium TaxID=2239 RepID=UPI0019626174|nr:MULTISPECIES: phosphoenolpyruvate carboxylase [Halobacterium]MCF2206533.1 phosphoenolpyruvate carboxylase [Halobacterium salinarum]MDL0123564.1 phosphoenolpyruvate carboxylase [Halobacterium salinarum]MDL0128769.1 phosphoenolpyruvate carboxylase [Halobacterium salinarum]QRY24506.1 phosphoenolpyruvate carboxylase [Halobacterium sp. BOL4-2]
MVDVPRLMSTQHPDNATLPFFTAGDVIEGEDEIQEAYYVYSHLGCDEQMWDFEGKEGDEYAVKKLLSRYDEFFADHQLGTDVRLTVRGPNPDVEGSEAKILLEILESIPRSFDAARRFAGEYGLETTAPIFEVIVPMVTDADQLNAVHEYYERFVTGKADEAVWDGRTVEEWVGEFDPASITVIPLIEEREAMLAADDIVREYATAHDQEAVRVFLARSDPALNYGCLAADLINKVALQRLYEMSEATGVDVHPILGAGSAPFRGNLTPERAAATADAYSEVETFTVQSAFKYDYPVETVRDGVATLRDADLGAPPFPIDEARALAVIDRTADAYADQVDAIAGTVNRLSSYVPDRRARKLHVGLFGYAREVGENALPRAIGYTASLYAVGCPPTLLGAHALTDDDAAFVREAFPAYFDHLADAARYFNPRCTDVLDLDDDTLAAAVERVDVTPNSEHRAATDDAIDALQRGDDDALRSAIRRGARERQFLG